MSSAHKYTYMNNTHPHMHKYTYVHTHTHYDKSNKMKLINTTYRKVTNLLSSCFLIKCLAFNQGHLNMFGVTARGLRKLLLAYWHAVRRGHPGMLPSTLQSKEWTYNKCSLGIQH